MPDRIMRRSRISVRPNIARPASRTDPGGRGLSGSQEGQHGQGSAAVDTTHAADTEDKEPVRGAAADCGQPVQQSAETAAGLNSSQDSLLMKVPPSLVEEGHDEGTPSDNPLTASALQRRKRFSVMPNLTKPRVTPTLRTPKPPLPTAAAPPSPTESPVPVLEDQATEDNRADQGIRPPSVAVLGEWATSQDQCGHASPAIPTTTCWEPAPEKKMKGKNEEEKAPSSDLQNEPQESEPCNVKPLTPEPFLGYSKLSRSNMSPEAGPSTSNFPLKVKSVSADHQRLMKARTLKKMMLGEARKERNQRKGKHLVCDYSMPLDHSKMTMRDLIYYMPDTNPMTLPEKKQEVVEEEEDEEEEEEDHDESMKEEDLLVPKVKVAEDGSLIIDEESLTVRVVRAKEGPGIVEGDDPVFVRGSTTTYTSFKKLNYSKPWSIKGRSALDKFQTDMFFLAIRMVGTDFSLICQLFPYRTRKEVKNKFKREERANSWRIDKAFREKRAFDLEFFSSLLDMVLAADKKKRNKSNTKGKKASAKGGDGDQATSDVEPDGDVPEEDSETAEKENEDCSNVTKATDATRRKRKRTKNGEEEEEPDTIKKQADGRKTKWSKKLPAGKKASVKGADGDQATSDVEPDCDVAERDSETNEKDNEDCSNVTKATDAKRVTKRKRKRTKKGEEEKEEKEKEGKKKKEEEKEEEEEPKQVVGEGAAGNQVTTDVEPDSNVVEGVSKPAEKEHENCSNVTQATDDPAVTRKKRKRSKKDEAVVIDVTEDEVANGQSVAEEAGRSEEMDNAAEEKKGKPARTTRGKARPNLGQGKRGKKVPESVEIKGDGSGTEEEDSREDGDSKVANGSGILEGKKAKRGRTAASPSNKETPEGDLQGAADIPPAQGQKLKNTTRSGKIPRIPIHPQRAEGEDHPIESPPCSPPHPEAASPKRRGKQPAKKPQPNLVAHQRSIPPSDPKLREDNEDEEHDEAQLEEEQGSPAHQEERVPVPLGLHSLELAPPSLEELEIPGCVPDAPGPGDSEGTLCSESGFEGTEEKGMVLSDHHLSDLDLLGDVMEALSPDFVEGLECGDSIGEAAQTLLSLSNTDLLNLSTAVHSPEILSAAELPLWVPVEEEEPESGHTDQSQCNDKPQQSVTCDVPITAVTESVAQSAPIDEPLRPAEEQAPTEEPSRLEESAAAAARTSHSESSVQNVPLGRRSRFPKPRPNLSESTRAPRTPPCHNTAAHSPEVCAASAAADTGSHRPAEAERSHVDPVREEESISKQKEEEGSVQEKLQQRDALSTPIRTSRLDSLVQNVPLGRRSRFPKPRPNLSESTRVSRTPPRHNTGAPSPEVCAASAAADTGSHRPAEAERSHVDPVREEESISKQKEEEGSVQEKLQQRDALSTPIRTSRLDSLVQNVPLGRRSRFPKPRPNLSESTRVSRTPPRHNTGAPSPVDDTSYATAEDSNTLSPVQKKLTCSNTDLSAEHVTKDIAKDKVTTFPEDKTFEEGIPTVETGTASSNFSFPLGLLPPHPGPAFRPGGPEAEGEETMQDTPASLDTPQEAASPYVDGDAYTFGTAEGVQGVSWAEDTTEEEPTFILTLFEIPQTELGEYQPGAEVLCPAGGDPFSPLMFLDPQSTAMPVTVSEPQNCESQSVETAEVESGCGSVTHLVLSDALISVSEGQEEGAAQDWTDLPEQSPCTDPSESAGETSSTAVQKEIMQGVVHPYEEDHGSQSLDSKSHDPVVAGTDGLCERDTLSIEKRRPPVRSRRGKLQVKPCITKRKTRGSMKDQQGIIPEEPEQPGPAQTSPQTCQPTAPHPDTQQDSVEEASDVSAIGELPQGIVGHSDLPQEEIGVPPGVESGSGGEELQINQNRSLNSCESLSVETAEVESGCGSVTHLVLSDALMPVFEGQEEGAAQDWTDLPEQSPCTDPSEKEGHGSQALDPAAESHDPVEAGTDGTSERDTLSIEKRRPPVRSRRGKLQVKPCITKRKTRGSLKDQQGIVPEEPEQPGPAQTSPKTCQPTAPHPDTQQDSVEEGAAASDMSTVGELPQGIVGHSDLPEEERGVAPGAESSSGGEDPQSSHNRSLNSCESLSVETAEAESGCGSVTHLVLSDALMPVSEGQEEGAAQDWTDLPEQSPCTDPSESAGETSSTAVQIENMHGLTHPYEEGHGSQVLDPVAESHDPVEAGTDGTSERDTLSIEKRRPPVRSRRGKLQVKPCITKRKTRGSMKDQQGIPHEEPEQPGPAQTSPQTCQPTAPHPDTQQDSVEEAAADSDMSAVGELPQGIVGHSDLPQEEREEGHGSQAFDLAAESHDPVEAGTDGLCERDTLSIEKRRPPVRSRRGKLQVKPCITKRKTRGSMKGILPEEPEQPGPAQTSPPTCQPTAPHPDTQQDSVEEVSDVSAAGELPQGIVGHSDLPQEETGVPPGAEGTESSGGGREPEISQNRSLNSCESLSVETAEVESGCGSVTHLIFSDALISVSEGQEEGAAQDWTDLPEQSPRTDPSESAGETSSTAVQKDNVERLADLCEEGHGSQTLYPVTESHNPMEAGTDGTSERNTLSIEKRSRRGSVPEEPEQPGPAQTSPQTCQPTAPHPNTQQDSVEEAAADSDVSVEGELPQGIVGHSDLPQEERGVAPGAEGTESSTGGQGLQPSHHSTPVPQRGALTRSGRVPRGFLSFISGSSDPGPVGAPRTARCKLLRPQVNTSRTGRKSTTKAVVIEMSSDSSTLNSPPTRVEASATLGGPSPETELLCGRTLETEEEPTTVSEYHFSDIFTEVEEPD
ncbi:hypothetical protein AAFF_G00086360 [Aldrovandia affinis]|uniref:Transcription factor TFIIIB component B'' Myb domain-containing protein n=1 Tax=Aldrovandia affinis TaxID=143900 RepID=A0AAD7RZ75_9TELE|nr:hypothetical protein AAFF_G00086360 [Aldrovandia affinis]